MAEDEKIIQEKYYRNGGNLMKLPNGNVRTLAIILALLLCTSFTGIVSAEALIQGNRARPKRMLLSPVTKGPASTNAR